MIEDASFLFGEKRYQKKMNLCRQMEQTIESELTFQEVLASCNLTGKEKLEKLWIDEQL